jgi:adenylate cyclase class IV
MEIEVKIRINSSDDLQKIETLLTRDGFLLKNVKQTNVFFDGFEGELGKNKSVARVRIEEDLETPAKRLFFLTFKSKSKIENGISRAEEREEIIDVGLAQCILNQREIEERKKLSPLLSEILTLCNDRLKQIGQFQNIRKTVVWKGYSVELDMTTYHDFEQIGYEIEIECDANPEKAHKEM